MASSASLFAKGPGVPDKGQQGLHIEVYEGSKKKKRYEVVISMGQLKWHTKIRYSEMEKFHEKVDKNFDSLSFLPMPSKKEWSEDSLKELLEDILQYETIRESVDLLKIIGIKTKITDDVPEYMRTFVENWRTPLEDLDKPIREAVGQLILFFRAGWDSFELARYGNIDGSYESANQIKKLDKKDQEYFDQITQEIFERLGLPAPKPGAPSQVPSLDSSIDVLREELDEEQKWSVVWEILLQATMKKGLDSRVLVSVQMCATLLGLSLEDLAVAEQECAAILQRQLIEMRKQKDNNHSKHRALKIGAGAAVGGGVMAVTGVLVLPLLVPAMMLGVTSVAAMAAPVAGTALASGVGAAGALLASASSFLPLFFGAFGAGLCGYKVGHVTEGIEEFYFVRVVAKEKEKSRSIIEIAALEDEDDDGTPGERFVLDIAGKRVIDLDQKQVLVGKEGEIDPQMVVALVHAAAGSIGFNPKKDGLKAAEERAASEDKHRLRNAKDRLHDKRARHKEAKKIKKEEQELKKQEEAAEKAQEEAKKEQESKSENESDSDTSRGFSPSIELKDKQELSELNEEESEMVENAGMEVVVCVNGWLWNADDIDEKFSYVRQLHPGAEVYSLAWQSEELLELGHFLTNFVKDEITSRILENLIVALSSSVGALLAALALPQYLMTAAALIDNPWTVVSNQARRAGKLLARAIISRAAGNRPITLIGWSHGARMIFSALEELNKLDNEDHRGLIQNVILMGAPVTTKTERWKAVRPLVAGRMVNCYSYADWLLPVIHRAGSGKIKPSAGNRAIEVPTVENFDITMIVGGHLNYSRRLKRILKFLDLQNSTAVSYVHRSCDEKIIKRIPDDCLKELHKGREQREEELMQELLKRREEVLATLIA